MASSSFNLQTLKSKEVTVTLPGTRSGATIIGIERSRIVSVVLKKSDDVYYEPIVYAVQDNGTLECFTASKTSATTTRNYTFLVWYL